MTNNIGKNILCKKTVLYDWDPTYNPKSETPFTEGRKYKIVNHMNSEDDNIEVYWINSDMRNVRDNVRSFTFFVNDTEYARKNERIIKYNGDYFYTPEETTNVLRIQKIDRMLNEK